MKSELHFTIQEGVIINKIPGTHKKERVWIVRMYKTSTVLLITEEICTKRNQDLMIRMKRNCQDKPSNKNLYNILLLPL